MDIFVPFIVRNLTWSQWLTKVFPVRLSVWAISFSWWGKVRSSPPAWMSMVSPIRQRLMTLHSMCQPGRPLPQGDS